MESPNCYKCRFFQLTYRTDRPYICNAMGFTSAAIPWRVVLQSSGDICRAFSPKPERVEEEARSEDSPTGQITNRKA